MTIGRRHGRAVHDLHDGPPAADLLAERPALNLVRAAPDPGQLARSIKAGLGLRLAGHQLSVLAEGEGETGLTDWAPGADAPSHRRQVVVAALVGATVREEQLSREVPAG